MVRAHLRKSFPPQRLTGRCQGLKNRFTSLSPTHPCSHFCELRSLRAKREFAEKFTHFPPNQPIWLFTFALTLLAAPLIDPTMLATLAETYNGVYHQMEQPSEDQIVGELAEYDSFT
jgi:hypothetical protein